MVIQKIKLSMRLTLPGRQYDYEVLEAEALAEESEGTIQEQFNVLRKELYTSSSEYADKQKQKQQETK